MKKFFRLILSAALAVIIGVGCLSGCRLVTIDSERDMAQVVATVNVVKEDKIYKKDIVMAYMNYGYAYATDTNQVSKDVFIQILDTLIESRVIVQSAMSYFEQDSTFNKDGTDANKWELTRYLTEEQETEAIYEARLAVNKLLDALEGEELTEKVDTYVGTARPVPTGAVNEEKELTTTEQKEYIAKPFDTGSTKERRAGFNSFITLLENNELKGSKYNGSIESTEYYLKSIQERQEALIIEEYQKRIEQEARKTIFTDSNVAYQKIEQYYNDIINEQKEFDNTEFVEKLSSATAEEPLLYGAYGNYGYVYNLLLGANEYQTGKIGEIDKNLSKAEYSAERKSILSTTSVVDQRSSWIVNGYDFNGTNFTGDYTFTESNSLSFKGTVAKIREENAEKDIKARYTVTSLTNYNLNDFLKEMDSYLGGTATDSISAYSKSINDVYQAKDLSGVTEYKEKINELLFAFSTDSGSLNTDFGYVIKPEVDGNNNEEYVESFGTAGRELLANGKNGYVVVASDYGYHVMFYSQIISKNSSLTFEQYLASLNINKTQDNWQSYLSDMLADWEEFKETDTPLYHFANQVVSATVNNAINEKLRDLTNDAIYEKNQVKKFPSAYADLVK